MISTKVSGTIGFLRHIRRISSRLLLLNHRTREVWSPIFDAVALHRFVVAQLILIIPKSFKTELPELRRAAAFDAPSRPFVHSLGGKTVPELLGGSSKSMVFKSVNGLAPQYIGNVSQDTPPAALMAFEIW